MVNKLKYENKKVLVTGATGMLGSRLVFDLLQKGFEIRAIYRDKKRIRQFIKNVEFYGTETSSLFDMIEWIEADLLNYSQLANSLDGIEMVFHCAAMVSFNPSDRELMFDINIHGTSNLVNACIDKGVKRICHVSSVAALGKTYHEGLIDEETAWVPEKRHSGYNISKFYSEMEIWRGINEGLDAIIVNPSVIIGPGDWRSGSPAFFNTIYKGLRFFPSGTTGFVDVRDVSKAILLLNEKSNLSLSINKRFLLNAANLSYEAVFRLIAVSIGVVPPKHKATKLMLGIAWRMGKLYGIITGKKPIITKENTLSSSQKSAYDGSKIKEMFGFCYRDIDDTITEIGRMFLKSNKSSQMR